MILTDKEKEFLETEYGRNERRIVEFRMRTDDKNMHQVLGDFHFALSKFNKLVGVETAPNEVCWFRLLNFTYEECQQSGICYPIMGGLVFEIYMRDLMRAAGYEMEDFGKYRLRDTPQGQLYPNDERAVAFSRNQTKIDYSDYLAKCKVLALSQKQTNEVWQKIAMTNNFSLQYRYLNEIGYFD